MYEKVIVSAVALWKKNRDGQNEVWAIQEISNILAVARKTISSYRRKIEGEKIANFLRVLTYFFVKRDQGAASSHQVCYRQSV